MTDQTIIEGAAVRLLNGKLQFQPRNDKGEVRWLVWYRDRHYEGATYDAHWLSADNANEIAALGLKSIGNTPYFDDAPIGWSTSQEMQAKVWAGHILATRFVATKFSRAAE